LRGEQFHNGRCKTEQTSAIAYLDVARPIGPESPLCLIPAALFQISRLRILPAGLCDLLRDQEIVFVGVGVGVGVGDDLKKKTGRGDFECAVLTSKTGCINLGMHAREGDVVQNKTKQNKTKQNKTKQNKDSYFVCAAVNPPICDCWERQTAPLATALSGAAQ
jgi:hypothetical protein